MWWVGIVVEIDQVWDQDPRFAYGRCKNVL